MSQSFTFPEPVITGADVNRSLAEQVLNRPLTFALTGGAAQSLDDKLAIDRMLTEFVLSEAEATFTSPVRHFFNPGGQQLQYNCN